MVVIQSPEAEIDNAIVAQLVKGLNLVRLFKPVHILSSGSVYGVQHLALAVRPCTMSCMKSTSTCCGLVLKNEPTGARAIPVHHTFTLH